MAELNEEQQELYDRLITGICLLSLDRDKTRELLIETLDNLVESLLKEWDNFR